MTKIKSVFPDLASVSNTQDTDDIQDVSIIEYTTHTTLTSPVAIFLYSEKRSTEAVNDKIIYMSTCTYPVVTIEENEKVADSNVISFLVTNEWYGGGAHSLYGSTGLNYDARTGELIDFSDDNYLFCWTKCFLYDMDTRDNTTEIAFQMNTFGWDEDKAIPTIVYDFMPEYDAILESKIIYTG